MPEKSAQSMLTDQRRDKIPTRPKPDSLVREESLRFNDRLRNLLAGMRESIVHSKAIDLSNSPHREVTEALHNLVYSQGDQAQLKIKYDDNSVGKPFPVQTLRLPDSIPAWKNEQELNIGTLSYRHLDYDEYVDLYLIRDRETRPLTNSQIDNLAYERMLEIISDPQLGGESYVAVYQTGLVPLAIGMYRAVVEHLAYRRQNNLPQLCVLPIYYAGGKDRKSGSVWV